MQEKYRMIVKNKKKILLINPPVKSNKKIIRIFDCGMESKGNYLYQPYSHLQLSALFVEHDVKFIDCVGDKIDLNDLLDFVKVLNPDLIISAVTNTTRNEDLCYVEKIKKLYPEIIHYIFGDLFTEKIYRDEFLIYADNVIRDPFLDCYYNIDLDWLSLIQSNFKINPSKYALGKHELFTNDSYRWPFSRHKKYSTIMFGWGCPYSCSYCPISLISYFHRDMESVKKELLYISELEVKELYISDKSFGIDIKKTLAILKYMTDSNFKFSWSTYLNPNQYSHELLLKMKLSGCHTIIVGIESTDEKLLKENNRYVGIDTIKKLIKSCSEIGIDICGDFIIGLPHDSQESITETIDFACRSGIDYASFNIATPLPGTSIKKSVIELGIYKEDEDYVDSSGFNGVLASDTLSAFEISHLKKKALIKFYLRPTYLLKRIFSIRSIDHFIIQFSEMIQMFRKG